MARINAWPEHDTDPCAQIGEHITTQRHPFEECPTFADAEAQYEADLEASIREHDEWADSNFP